MYTYPWYHWIIFFFLYSFFGWIIESTYVSILSHRFVNRGFLRLPMLPLYGTGAVMMLWLSLPVKDSVILVYLAGVVGATALEYVTGWAMERLFKMRYWDYSDQRFNVNGYICLSSSLAWGFLTIFLTEVVHQPIAALVMKMDFRVEMVLICVVGTAFAADTVVSVKEALSLGKALEAMTKMKAELDELQVQAALLRAEIEERLEALGAADVRAEAAVLLEQARAEAAARVAEVREGAATRVAEVREGAAARMAEVKEGAAVRAAEAKADVAARVTGVREEAAARAAGVRDEAAAFVQEKLRREASVAARIHALDEKRQAVAGHMNFYRRNLLTGNPSAASARFSAALKEMRDRVEEMRKH